MSRLALYRAPVHHVASSRGPPTRSESTRQTLITLASPSWESAKNAVGPVRLRHIRPAARNGALNGPGCRKATIVATKTCQRHYDDLASSRRAARRAPKDLHGMHDLRRLSAQAVPNHSRPSRLPAPSHL